MNPALTRNPHEQTVGVAEMRVGRAPGRLVTYALGSCIGVTVYDPAVRVGGMLHAMIASSSVSPERAQNNPYMFVDTGVPLLFRACYKAGAERARLVIKVAGGANPHGAMGVIDHFRIGERNVTMLERLLRRNDLVLHASDVGGRICRTMSLNLLNGEVTIKTPREERVL